jgi:hypothetical protein
MAHRDAYIGAVVGQPAYDLATQEPRTSEYRDAARGHVPLPLQMKSKLPRMAELETRLRVEGIRSPLEALQRHEPERIAA